MRATIYARISSDREGAGLGVRDQEVDCRELADRRGHEIVSVHTDNDVSAYSGKPRPGYRALLQDIREGRVDVVLAWHTDRLHRSPVELEAYAQLSAEHGVTTETVKAGPLDLATPSGLLVARMLGNVARYEVEHMVERQRRAKKRAAESGTWKGGPRPFGFKADGVTLREDEARLIREAVPRVLAGESLRGIARDWNAQGSTTAGGRPWDGTSVRRVLLRARNAGLMTHNGDVIGAAEWPAIIPEESWRAVVAYLSDPARRKNAKNVARRWQGSGLYLCGVCEGPIQGTTNSNRRKVYRCADGHVSRNLAEVDGYVNAVVVERLRQPDAREVLAPKPDAGESERLHEQAMALRSRLDELATLFADGAIDAQQLARGSAKLNTDLDLVRGRIASAMTGSAGVGIVDAPDPGAAWLEAPLDRRRAVLDALLTVTLLPGRGRPPGWQPGQSYFNPELVRIEWKA